MREFDLGREFDGFDKGRHSRSERMRPFERKRRGTSSAVAGIAKYALDAVLAAIGLIVLMPMIAILMGTLLVLQGRPIFIAHRRIGKHGVMFPCLKFRTMVANADEVLKRHLAANPHHRAEWNATRKLRDDPRVTPFGALLRKTSIDEIPQLLNVIQGKMSLVGPRPIVASEAELYGVHYSDYIQVRPGLTGLWQVSGRSDTSYGERVQLDVRYVREQSILGDIAILLKTVPAVLRSRGSY
ncbi:MULTISPECIES: sugar transferase [unclassified Rhizobium]|uniref:sugar transferase n=1 Tax=unclassified Rhizobium TaxID=2613769 RepID=UPI0021680A15|nr:MULTISPECIES: sugar transferase [unclassified Rhizobium]MCS3742186.1 exopolysaccharide production protein ExoY [Rhizobium sp. BK661]MCS4094113.1 exopolysaccharide production protein ExoY [Rhizobium sp. BK176]